MMPDFYVAFVAPWIAIMPMYFVASLLKMSSTQLNKSTTSKQFDRAIWELRQEMRLRFILGYTVEFMFFAASLWYIIQFTSTFGHKVSWVFFFVCCISVAVQQFIYDPLIILGNYFLIKWWKKCGMRLYRIRTIKMGHCEILEDPFLRRKKEALRKGGLAARAA